MTDVKLDPLKTWFQSPMLIACIVIAASGTALYLRLDHTIGEIAASVERDVKDRAEERDRVVDSVREVRDELRSWRNDSVALRQWQAWIELAKALNKDKGITWPELPR